MSTAGSRARWLQLNVYAHPGSHDTLLTDLLAPAVTPLMRSSVADLWFYVRYADQPPRGAGPRHHLRIRLLAPPGNHPKIERRLRSALAGAPAAGFVETVSRARYRAEVQRYGGAHALGHVERVFAVDSAVSVAILRRTPRGAGRASAATRSVEALLTALGLGPRRRRAVYAGLAQFQVARGWLGRSPQSALADLFRARRVALGALLQTGTNQGCISGTRRAYAKELGPIGRLLRSFERTGLLTASVNSIASSLVHMHVNRLGMRNDQEAAFLWCLWRATEEFW